MPCTCNKTAKNQSVLVCGEGGLAALSPVSGTGSLPTGLSADRTHHRLAHRWFRRPRASRRKEGRVEEAREEGRKGGVSEGGRREERWRTKEVNAWAKERTGGNEKFKRDGRWGGRLWGREGGTPHDRKKRQETEFRKKFRHEGKGSDRGTNVLSEQETDTLGSNAVNNNIQMRHEIEGRDTWRKDPLIKHGGRNFS